MKTGQISDEWRSVIEAYGFREYSFDLSEVDEEDAMALIDFMRVRKFGVTPLGIRRMTEVEAKECAGQHG
jgi:spore germination protein YaaH